MQSTYGSSWSCAVIQVSCTNILSNNNLRNKDIFHAEQRVIRTLSRQHVDMRPLKALWENQCQTSLL
jgi:hypothetical protein